MTKRVLIGLFILLMVAVSIIAFNFYKNVKQPLSPTSFEAVPQHAALIIKEENFSNLLKKLNSTNMIWELLVDSTQATSELNDQFTTVDSLLNANFKKLIKSREAMASLHLSGANNYDFIYYFPLPGEDKEKDFLQQLKSAFKTTASTRVYDGANIHSFSKGDKKWSLCLYQNTLAFSQSTVLIEDVIRELNSPGSLLTDKAFEKMLKSSGQAEDGNVFVNNKHFSKVVFQFLNKSAKTYAKNISQYAGWTELDLSIKPNSIGLNGFSFAQDANYINLLKNQKPQEIELFEHAPYNTAFLFQYGLSDVNEFLTQRKNLLKSTNQFFNYQKFLDDQTKAYGIDLEVELLGHMSEEIALVITESQGEKFYDHKFMIYKVKDVEQALTDLQKISASTGAKEDTSSFRNYKVGKINIKGLFPKLLGKPFLNLTAHYYTALDDYILFANSPKALENYVTTCDNEKTLDNDENFENFEDNLASSSNCMIYQNIARSVNLYKTLCSDDLLPIIEQNTATLRKFEALAFQMSTEKGKLFYNNIFIKYNPVYKQETGSLWELALDTITTNAPQLVVNHTTGAKEILIQDDAHKLYLIGSTGKIQWTKQLQEQIIGKVHQIDVYKNNKLQLLFNTSSKLYLIDRNGNNVEQYPVKLPSKAVNAVTPMDYDNNRNYRIMVGCSDNMVYNYDVTGAKVKGWEYTSTTSAARGKMWHFAIGGKDYIVIPLSSGEVNVVERSGKTRLSLASMLPKGNTVYLKVGTSLAKSYLISADTNATVVKVYFNDKKEAIKLDDIPSKATFSLVDFDKNKINDYCFSWGNQVKVVSQEKKVLHEMELTSQVVGTPSSFNSSSYTIGVVTAGNIYLLDNKGMIQDGFPLKGSTLFEIADVNNDNTNNLVVVDKKILYMYNLK